MLTDQIFRWASTRPDKTAIIQDGDRITYAEFWRRIQSTKDFLRSKDVPRRGVCVVISTLISESWIICLALRDLGVTTVVVNDANAVKEFNFSDLSCIIVAHQDSVYQTSTNSLNIGAQLILMPHEAIKGVQTAELCRDCEYNEPIGGHIIYTSGTTGAYKKILLSSALEDARNKERARSRSFGEATVLNGLRFPVWAGMGFKNPSAIWHVGASIVFDQRPNSIANLLDHGVSCAYLTPIMMRELAYLLKHTNSWRSSASFRVTAVAGFLSPRIARDIFRSLTRKIEILYSATELTVSPMKSVFRNDDDAFWLRIEHGRRVEVVSESGHVCAPGEQGFLRIQTTGLDSCRYFEDDEATKDHFRDGFFYPGDIAVTRPDGRVRILGRISDVINMQGVKIPVAPLEQDLQNFLDAQDVCVFSHLNNIGQEELLIAVEGSSPLDERKMESIRQQFASFDSIKFHILECFPRTLSETRKVRRFTLRNMLVDQRV